MNKTTTNKERIPMFIPCARAESERPKHTAQPCAEGADKTKVSKANPWIKLYRVEIKGS